MQALAAERVFEMDPACRSGMALAVVTPPGACRLVAVVVGGAEALPAGAYQLSVKYPDGVRGELAVSKRTYLRFRKVGRTAFVQFYAARISGFGDLAYAEASAGAPPREAAAARRRAVLATGTAAGVSALAVLVAVRRRGERPAARGGSPSRANDGA